MDLKWGSGMEKGEGGRGGLKCPLCWIWCIFCCFPRVRGEKGKREKFFLFFWLLLAVRRSFGVPFVLLLVVFVVGHSERKRGLFCWLWFVRRLILGRSEAEISRDVVTE